MIPPDVANSLRLLAPDLHSATQAQTQPVLPAQRIADVLGNLVPGQRFLAEIQALLPNGTYRAVVAQRQITLALPFAAKPGDSLELEVVESDGSHALALVSNSSPSSSTATGKEAVATSLSQTGKLIGDLLSGIDNQGKRAPAAPLNGSRPLVSAMPANAAELAPVLKQALTQSGMFYEAHQARWVAGEIPTSRLLLEPQGQHSQAWAMSQALATTSPSSLLETVATSPDSRETATGVTQTAANVQNETLPPRGGRPEIAQYQQAQAAGQTETSSGVREGHVSANTASLSGTQPTSISPELAPLVQQQLDALATQTFAWQGQIWPGQQMSWEIDERQGNRGNNEDEASGQWQTRLKLTLPHLGGIDANLRLLPGGQVEISLAVTEDGSEATLGAAGLMLKQQFEAAGLNLTQFSVKHESPTD